MQAFLAGIVTLAGVSLGAGCGPKSDAAGGRAAGSTAEQAEAAATRAAEVWLDLVDQGEYAASWEAAAPLFQKAVSKEHWTAQLGVARAPLGPCESRKRRSAKYAHEVPGAPDGEYVVLQFDSRFKKKKRAVETVTPSRGEDGVWRVAGYFIR